MESSYPWSVFAPITPRVLIFPVGSISESSFNGILSEFRAALKNIEVSELFLGKRPQFYQPTEAPKQLPVDIDFTPVTSSFVQQYLLTQISWEKIQGLLSATAAPPRMSVGANMSPTPLSSKDQDILSCEHAVTAFLSRYNGMCNYDDIEDSEELMGTTFPPSFETLTDEQMSVARSNTYVIGLGLAPGSQEEDAMDLPDLISAFSNMSTHKVHSSDSDVPFLLKIEGMIGFRLVIYDKWKRLTAKGLPTYLSFIGPEMKKEELLPIVRSIYGRIEKRGSQLVDAKRALDAIGSFSLCFGQGGAGGLPRPPKIPRESFFIGDIADLSPAREPVNVLSLLSPETNHSRETSYGSGESGDKLCDTHDGRRRRAKDRLGATETSASFSGPLDPSDADGGGSRAGMRGFGKESSKDKHLSKKKNSSRSTIRGSSKKSGNEMSSDAPSATSQRGGVTPLSTGDTMFSYEEFSQLGPRGHSRTVSHIQQYDGIQSYVYELRNNSIAFRLNKMIADCLLILGYAKDATDILRSLISSPPNVTTSDRVWLGAAFESMICAIALPRLEPSRYPRLTGRFTLKDLSVDAARNANDYAKDIEPLYKGRLLAAHSRALFLRMATRSWVVEQEDGANEANYLIRDWPITSVPDCFSRHLVSPSNCLWCAVHNLAKDKAELTKALKTTMQNGSWHEPPQPTLESYGVAVSVLNNAIALTPRPGELVGAMELGIPHMYRLALLATYHDNQFYAETIAALMVFKLLKPDCSGSTLSQQLVKSGEVFIGDLSVTFPTLFPFSYASYSPVSSPSSPSGTSKKQITGSGTKSTKSLAKSAENSFKNRNVFPHLTSQLMSSLISLISVDPDHPNFFMKEYPGSSWQQIAPNITQSLVNRLNILAKINGIAIRNTPPPPSYQQDMSPNCNAKTTRKISGTGAHPLGTDSPLSLNSTSRSGSSEHRSNSRPAPSVSRGFLQPLVLPYSAKLKMNTTLPALTPRDDIGGETDSDNGEGDDGPFLYCDFADSKKKRKGKRNQKIISLIGIDEQIDVTLSLKGKSTLMNEHIRNARFDVSYVEGYVCDKEDHEDPQRKAYFYSLPNKITLSGCFKIRLMLFLEKASDYADLADGSGYIQLRHIRGVCGGDDVVIDLPVSSDSCTCFRPVQAPQVSVLASNYLTRVGIRSISTNSESLSSLPTYLNNFRRYIQPINQNLPIHLAGELPSLKEVGAPFCVCESEDKGNGSVPSPLLVGLTVSIGPHVTDIEFVPVKFEATVSDGNSCDRGKNKGCNGEVQQDSDVRFSLCTSPIPVDSSVLQITEVPIVNNTIQTKQRTITLWFEVWDRLGPKERRERSIVHDPSFRQGRTRNRMGDSLCFICEDGDHKFVHSIRFRLKVKSEAIERLYGFTYYWTCETGSKCSLCNVALEGAVVPLQSLPPSAMFGINVIPNNSLESFADFLIALTISNDTNERVSLIASDDFVSVDTLSPKSTSKCIVVVKEEELCGANTPKARGIVNKILTVRSEEELGLYWAGSDGVPHTFTRQTDEAFGRSMIDNLSLLRKLVRQLYPRLSSVKIKRVPSLGESDYIIHIDTANKIFCSASTLTSESIFNIGGECARSLNVIVQVDLLTQEPVETLLIKLEDKEQLYNFAQLVETGSSGKSVVFETTFVNVGKEQCIYICAVDSRTRMCRTVVECRFH